jgi:hypothetical protein
MKPKHLFVVLLAAALLLSACGGSAAQTFATDEFNAEVDGLSDTDALAPTGAEAERALEVGASADGQFAGDPNLNVVVPAAEDRIIIKNANLTMEVEHPAAQVDAIMRLAEEMGGFVVTSNVYAQASGSGYDVPSAEITIRVPASQFNRVLASLEGDANRVLTKSVTGQDVTQQYTDLQSRLRNLEATAEQLQIIMLEADKTTDVLAVYNELVHVNEQAEVLRGQIKYYAEAAAFSAIAIQLRAPVPVVEYPAPRPAWQRAFDNASEALGEMLEATSALLIWLGVFLLPTLLIYVSPFVGLWLFARWLRNRRAAGTPSPAGN